MMYLLLRCRNLNLAGKWQAIRLAACNVLNTTLTICFTLLPSRTEWVAGFQYVCGTPSSSKPVAGSSLNSALECNRASKINVLEERGGFWDIVQSNIDAFISPQSAYLTHAASQLYHFADDDLDDAK
eukprot:scaffold3978_cov126-Skeletonema_dohrnii-CCMP3373.AAC.3